MGYQLVKHLESAQYNRKLFYLDRGAIDLPPIRNKSDIMPGSEARSLLTGEKWILNSQYQWMYVGANGETVGSSREPDPVVEGVVITPNNLTVAPGATVSFLAEVSVTGDLSKDVTWKVSKATSKDTMISSSGVLKVGADETAKALTIVATSVANPTVSSNVTLKVSDTANTEPKLYGLTLSPEVNSVALRPVDEFNANATFFEIVLSGANIDESAVNYEAELVGATSENTGIDLEMDGDEIPFKGAVVVVGEDETANLIIVKVTAELAGQKASGKAILNVAKATASDPVITGVTVAPQSITLPKNTSFQLAARVEGTNNPSQDIVWILYDAQRLMEKGVTLSKNGLLYTGDYTGSIMAIATSIANTQIQNAVMIEVVAEAEIPSQVLSVELNPDIVTAIEGERQLFKATVVGYNGVSQEVKWTVKGAKSNATEISEVGALSISVGEAGSLLHVIATSVADTSVYGEALVNVVAKNEKDDCCNVTVNVTGGGGGIEEIPTDDELGNYTRGMVDGKPEWKPVEKPDLTPYLKKTDAANTYATKAELNEEKTNRDASDLEMFNRLTDRIDKTVPRDLDGKSDHVVTDVKFENQGEDDVIYSVSCYFPNAEEAPAGYDGYMPRATQAQAGIMTAETYRNLEQAMRDIANLQSAGGDFIGCYDTKADMDAGVVKAITDGWDTGDFAYVIHDEDHEDKMTCYLLNTQSKAFVFAFEFPIPQIDLSGYIPRNLDGRASLLLTDLSVSEANGSTVQLIVKFYSPSEGADDVAHIDSKLLPLPVASTEKAGVLSKEDYAKFAEAYNKAREGGSFLGIVETEEELTIAKMALTTLDLSKAKEGDFVIVLMDSTRGGVATMYQATGESPVTWSYLVDVYKNPDLSDYMTREEIQQAVAELLGTFATKEELATAMSGLVSQYEMSEALNALAQTLNDNIYQATNGLWERISELATKEELAQAVSGLATEDFVNSAIADFITRTEVSGIESAIRSDMQSGDQTAEQNANTYTDTKIGEANQYTDQKFSEAQQYADSKLSEANQYTDAEIGKLQQNLDGKVSQETLDKAIEGVIPRGMDGAEPKIVMNTIYGEKDGQPYNTVTYYYPKLKKTETKDNYLPIASESATGYMTPDMVKALAKAAADIEDLQRAGGDFIASYLDKATADKAISKVIAAGTWNDGDFCYVLNDEGHEGKMTCYILNVALTKWVFAFEFPIPQIDLTGYIPRDLDKAASQLITGFRWSQEPAAVEGDGTELHFQLDTYDPNMKMGPSLDGPVPLASETTGGVISSKTYAEIMKVIAESAKGGRLWGIVEGTDYITQDLDQVLSEANAKAAIGDGAKEGDYLIIFMQGDISMSGAKIGHISLGTPVFAILKGVDSEHPYFEVHKMENGFGRIASIVSTYADINGEDGIQALLTLGYSAGDYIIVKTDETHNGESSLYVLQWSVIGGPAHVDCDYVMRLGGLTTPEGKTYLEQNPVIITVNAENYYEGYPGADKAIVMNMEDFVPAAKDGSIKAIEILNQYDFTNKDVILNFATIHNCNGGLEIIGEMATRCAEVRPYWFAGASSLKVIMGIMKYSTSKEYNTWLEGTPGQHPFTGYTAGLPGPEQMFQYWQDPVQILSGNVNIVKNIGRGPYLEIKGTCPMPVYFGGCLPFAENGQERYVICDGANVTMLNNSLIMNDRDSAATNVLSFSEMITVRDGGKLTLPNEVAIMMCGKENWTSTGSYKGRAPFYLFTAKNNGVITRGHVNRYTQTESAIDTKNPKAFLNIRAAIYTVDNAYCSGVECLHCFQATHNGVISLLPYLSVTLHSSQSNGAPIVMDIMNPPDSWKGPGYLPIGDALVGGIIEIAKDCAPEGFAFDSSSGGIIYRRDLDADTDAYRYQGDIIDRHLDMHDPKIIEPSDSFRVVPSIDHPTPSEYYD